MLLRMSPNSKECVELLLSKFKNSISIYKGYSKEILPRLRLEEIDFVFLDGGHSYNTVKEDLNILRGRLKKKSVIICDDYNISHYGVNRAVNEIRENYEFKDYGRFALIKI